MPRTLPNELPMIVGTLPTESWSLDEMSTSAREAAAGHYSERPFVIAAQPTVVDPSRASAIAVIARRCGAWP